MIAEILSRSRFRLVCIALLAALHAACGQDRPTSPGAATPPTETASLSGTVTDANGGPLAGATVTLQDSKYGKTTQTDAAGAYRLSGFARGSYPLFVHKGGYQSVWTNVTLSAQETTRSFQLVPGVAIVGRVTEPGIGALQGATVEVTSGADAGKTSPPSTAAGAYTLQYVLPGRFTLRARKAGYDTVDRTVEALDDVTVDFELKSSYGTCLVSVAPLLIDHFPSAGGTASIAVGAARGRTWTAVSDEGWVELPSSAGGTGPGSLLLRILPAAAGATSLRTATVRVGCGPTEGQNVRVSQVPPCQVDLSWASDSPMTFPAAGGTGHLILRTGTPGCWWEAVSRDDWIRPAGVAVWSGDFDPSFTVLPNNTGAPRTGTIVFGEKPWEVRQER